MTQTMDDQEKRITEFREAAKRYFESMLLLPANESFEKTLDGSYHQVCSIHQYFKKTDDNTPYQIVCATTDWINFVSQAQKLFDNKISFTRMDSTLMTIVCSSQEWPFSEEQISQYIDKLQDWAEKQFQTAFTAVVPLYNLMMSLEIDQVPLANSILHRGSSDSLLATLSKNKRLGNWLTLPSDANFLAIPVSGDHEAVTHVARLEANRSLALLCFICHWTQRISGLNYMIENEASHVTLFPSESAQFLYYDPNLGTDALGGGNITGKALYLFDKRKLESAKDIYELDNLNYHFQNEAIPVSSRIVRALELYDSGVRASPNWQALYRYVASINTAVLQSRDKRREMTLRLQKIIEFGGNYVGPMDDLDEIADDLESRRWSELVKKTAKPFDDFYVLRGRIIHGDVFDPTSENVHKVRVLANNAIRLMAKLAREFNWITKSDIEKWFKNPSYPPSLELPADTEQS